MRGSRAFRPTPTPAPGLGTLPYRPSSCCPAGCDDDLYPTVLRVHCQLLWWLSGSYPLEIVRAGDSSEGGPERFAKTAGVSAPPGFRLPPDTPRPSSLVSPDVFRLVLRFRSGGETRKVTLPSGRLGPMGGPASGHLGRLLAVAFSPTLQASDARSFLFPRQIWLQQESEAVSRQGFLPLALGIGAKHASRRAPLCSTVMAQALLPCKLNSTWLTATFRQPEDTTSHEV